MKIKKPSLKGMKNTEYLGRFQKDEFIQQGHNFMLGQMKGALSRALASQVGNKMQNPNMPAPEAMQQAAMTQQAAPQVPMGGGMMSAVRRALGAGQAPQGQARPMIGRIGRMLRGRGR